MQKLNNNKLNIINGVLLFFILPNGKFGQIDTIIGEKINSKILGTSEFSSNILLKPAPRDAPTNNCGVIPIIDPRKKFLTLTLNIVGNSSKLVDRKKIPSLVTLFSSGKIMLFLSLRVFIVLNFTSVKLFCLCPDLN